MQEGDNKYASEARFIRKKYKEGGYDEQQQQEQREFQENFEKALKNHSKKQLTKDVEKQVEYFGYKIEPFNMRQEQEMGQIDQDGFFVFNKRKRMRDAWMDSLNENDGEEQIDKLRKKIKQQHREKNVYQAQKKIQQSDKQDEEQQQQEQQPENKQNQIEQQNKFEPKEIKLLLADLLPFNTSANQYMKKLKKQKNTELYDKILLLCNEYIALTSQHDILTLKKEDLEEQQEQQQEKPIMNWDKDQSEQKQPQNKGKAQKEQQNRDQDDIF